MKTAEENKKTLDQAIHSLEAYTGSIEFFERAQNVQSLFNTLNPLHPNEREVAWTLFQKQWDKHNEALKLYADPYREKAALMLTKIKNRLQYIHFNSDSEPEEIKEFFTSTQDIIKELENFLSSGILISKENKKEFWSQVREQKSALQTKRQEVFKYNVELARESLNHLTEMIETRAPNQTIKEYKRLQKKVLNHFLDRKDKDKLAQEFQKLWLRLQERFDEKKEEQAQKQQVYYLEQKDRLGRMEYALERLGNNIEKQKQHILDNQQRLKDEYRAETIDKIRNWISQDREKVKDMEKNQLELKAKIEKLKKHLQKSNLTTKI